MSKINWVEMHVFQFDAINLGAAGGSTSVAPGCKPGQLLGSLNSPQ